MYSFRILNVGYSPEAELSQIAINLTGKNCMSVCALSRSVPGWWIVWDLAIVCVILWMWVYCKLENEVCRVKYLIKQSEKKVNLALSTPWRHRLNRGIAPLILNPDNRWRWGFIFTQRPLYHRGQNSWYPLNRRLDGTPTVNYLTFCV